MKIEEKFYTISETQLKWLCKNHALRFQEGFEESDFFMFFEDNKTGMVNQKNMAELTFSIMVNDGSE